MAKQIPFPELAQIVATLINRPDVLGEVSELDTHRRFVQDIAEVVADYCGGTINGVYDGDLPADAFEGEKMPLVAALNDDGSTVSVSPNESMGSLRRNVWSLFCSRDWDGETGGAEDDVAEMSPSEKNEAASGITEILTALAFRNPAGSIPCEQETPEFRQARLGPLVTGGIRADEEIADAHLKDSVGPGNPFLRG